MTALGSFHAPLTRAHPLIIEAVSKLKTSAEECQELMIPNTSLTASKTAQKYLFLISFSWPMGWHHGKEANGWPIVPESAVTKILFNGDACSWNSFCSNLCTSRSCSTKSCRCFENSAIPQTVSAV